MHLHKITKQVDQLERRERQFSELLTEINCVFALPANQAALEAAPFGAILLDLSRQWRHRTEEIRGDSQ